MSEGWISLNRTIRDHWLYEKRILSKFEAWVEMLMMANHQDNKFLLGNDLINLKRGQFVTSELKLMDRWGWSKTKVRNFLKILEEDNMIIKKSDKKKTTLTICNYSLYQDKRTTERPQRDHKKTTEKPQEDTNNNENNDNNDNKKRFVPPTFEEVSNYCIERNNSVDIEKFINFYESKGWMVGKNKMKSWKASVRTWESKDKQQVKGEVNTNW